MLLSAIPEGREKLDLMIGRLQYEVTLELMRGHTLVWLDGIPLTKGRAVRKIKARASDYDSMLTRCWPIDPSKIGGA